MTNKLESEAGNSALPPPKIGKRKGEDGDKEQVNAKKQKQKQKRDVAAEEQNNKEEINSDNSQQVKKPDAEPSEPATGRGSLDDGSLESDFGRSPDSNEDNGEVDISKGECSEHCDEEAQKPVKGLKSSKYKYNWKEIKKKLSKTPHEWRETPGIPNRKYASSKIIYVGNLSYSVERADMEDLFKDCGAVVDIRFNIDHEGRFRGFGHVEFGTAEAAQKALELDNTEVLRRRIKVNIARPLENDDKSNWSNLFHKGETSTKGFGTSLVENKSKTPALANNKNAVSKTIHVGNLSYTAKRADMERFFKNCGEIVDVRLPRDHEGRLKGFGHVEFATAEAAQKALELDNTIFLKRRIFVDIAQERGDYTPSRSSFHKDESSQSQTVPVKCNDPPIAEHKLTCAEEVKDMEMFDAASTENEVPETPATQQEEKAVPVKCSDTPIAEHKLTCAEEVKDMEIFDAASTEKEVPETPATQQEKKAVPVKCSDTPIAEHKLTCAEEVKDMEIFDAASTEKEVPETPATHKEIKAVPVKCSDTPIAEHKLTCAEEVKDMEMLDAASAEKPETPVAQKAKIAVPVKCLDTPIAEHKLTCAEEVKNMKMFDAASAENPETPATQKEIKAASKTICVRNLSFGVERADIENIFKDCGEIVDVRLQVEVEFATAEAAEKALELDYTELLNRPKKVCITPEKGEHFPNKSCLSDSSQKGEGFQSLTVFVVGFDKSIAEEKIKASLEEHFHSCGEITRISLPKYHHGAIKGFAHLEFKDFDSYKKALQLDKTELRGFRLLVDKAKPKVRHDDQGIGGFRGSGSYHFGGRDGGSRGGRVGWGDSQGIGGGRGGAYQYGERDAGNHGGRVGWGDNQRGGRGGGYQYGERDAGNHGGRVGWGDNQRGGRGGGYQYGERDAGNHGGRVGWGDNQRGGRGGGSYYHSGGKYGGDHGGRVGWGGSHVTWRH